MILSVIFQTPSFQGFLDTGFRSLCSLGHEEGTVIGITQSSPKEGAWSGLFSNQSQSGLDKYSVKRS